MIMAESKRDALLAMHGQTGEAQRQVAERQATRDLSQLRPVVREDVGRRQEDARQVFTLAMAGFMATKPEIEREMRKADSQLLRFHQMSEA